MLGAYKLIFNVGDWGWLIGSSAAAVLYWFLSAAPSRGLVAAAGE